MWLLVDQSADLYPPNVTFGAKTNRSLSGIIEDENCIERNALAEIWVKPSCAGPRYGWGLVKACSHAILALAYTRIGLGMIARSSWPIHNLNNTI
jgi:hypothetical protein